MSVWVGKEADNVIVIGRVVSAEVRLVWPICVCIGRVALYRPCLSLILDNVIDAVTVGRVCVCGGCVCEGGS